jgi:hypothetical protein
MKRRTDQGLDIMAAPTHSSIMTVSGRYFDPLDPDPRVVDLEDMAHALGRIRRFNGHTVAPTDPDPLTVAAHSLRVCRIGMGFPLALASEWKLALLLHDAAEAYVGDIVRPLKTDAQREIEHAVLRVIIKAVLWMICLDNDETTERILALATGPSCKRADDIALTMEALLFQPGAHDWAMPLDGMEREEVCQSLPLFWGPPGEDWAAEVRCALNGIDAYEE